MIPYSYNMVDMGGIDLAEANGTVVEGLYNRLALARNACGDLILYNWKFVGIEIAPSPCSTLDEGASIIINGMIEVTDEDIVNILTLEPEPPVIEQLTVTENGTYNAPAGIDGYSPIIVNVSVEPNHFDLPYSSEDKIVALASAQNFDPSSLNWGGLTKEDTSNYLKQGNFVTSSSRNLSYVPQSGEVSFTAYSIIRCLTNTLGRILTIYTGESNPGKPAWFTERSIYKVYDNGNVDTSVNSQSLCILAISRDADTSAVKWYINGTLFREATGYTSTPAYVYFNGTGSNYRQNMDIYMAAVVDEAESEQTVIANMNYLQSVLDQ